MNSENDIKQLLIVTIGLIIIIGLMCAVGFLTSDSHVISNCLQNNPSEKCQVLLQELRHGSR